MDYLKKINAYNVKINQLLGRDIIDSWTPWKIC